MYYLLLFAATILFASQFLFNQKFEEKCGSTLTAAMLFSLISTSSGFLILFTLNGFKLSVTPFSVALALIASVIDIAYSIASVKSLSAVNLSAYSVFAMLGGMLLPSTYGIIFLNEALTATKILCCLLIISALFLTVDFGDKSGKKIYYMLVFLMNGSSGVVSVIHQNDAGGAAVDSFSFLMLARMFSAIICLVFCIANFGKIKKLIAPKPAVYAVGYAAFCGIGNLFSIIALKHLPASVQMPIITGGVMVISFVISVLRRQKPTLKNAVATLIALVSTILIAF